ncbi:hypothetical protein CA54_08280 [Symmachiella macrocystis]|uniref:Uncharacterized protein n=1 Tax=Symmachiella macrocystis TaxID=2527985 RepID=A0A5C6BJS8_9PLAN|nr:hypothetical protein CA54_08280 [Symmachiella macrocystis]
MKSVIDDGFGRANESLIDDDRVSKSRRDFYTIRFKSFVSHSGGGTKFFALAGVTDRCSPSGAGPSSFSQRLDRRHRPMT